jgi:hypothetical protein
MLTNADYIWKELPSIRVAEPYKNSISEVCSALTEAKYDVINELFELNKLNRPAASTVVQDRVERIQKRLDDEIPKLDALIKSLYSASKSQINYGLAYFLVVESATNILQSLGQVSEAMEHYRTATREGTGA